MTAFVLSLFGDSLAAILSSDLFVLLTVLFLMASALMIMKKIENTI